MKGEKRSSRKENSMGTGSYAGDGGGGSSSSSRRRRRTGL